MRASMPALQPWPRRNQRCFCRAARLGLKRPAPHFVVESRSWSTINRSARHQESSPQNKTLRSRQNQRSASVNLPKPFRLSLGRGQSFKSTDLEEKKAAKFRARVGFWPLFGRQNRILLWSGADCKSAGFTPSVVRIHSCPSLSLRLNHR